MKRHKILGDAAAELDASSSWYEQQASGLGLDLLAEYRDRLASALETSGTISGTPTVLAFECSSRRPGYWRDRLG